MQNAIHLHFNQNATSPSFFSPTHQQIRTGLKIIIGYSSVIPPVRIYTLNEGVSYVELILSSLAISHKLGKWTCCVLLFSSSFVIKRVIIFFGVRRHLLPKMIVHPKNGFPLFSRKKKIF